MGISMGRMALGVMGGSAAATMERVEQEVGDCIAEECPINATNDTDSISFMGGMGGRRWNLPSPPPRPKGGKGR